MQIAVWSSKGARWTAVLYRQDNGYRLSERKHGQEVGASWRPFTLLRNDAEALAYYGHFVRDAFDVPMARVQA